MATQLDTRIRAVVARLLAKYGVTATITPLPVQSYSPMTGGMIISEAASPFSVVMTPPEDLELKEAASPMGTLSMPVQLEGADNIRRAKFRSLVKAEGIEQVPSTDMRLTFQDVVYQIVATGPLYSGELVAAYVVYLAT